MIGAVIAAVVAVVCFLGPPAPRLRMQTRRPVERSSRRWLFLVAAVPPILAALAGGSAVAITIAAELVAATVGWLVWTGWRRKRALADAEEIAHGCQVLTGQLRVGRIPIDALAVAAQDCPILAHSHRLHLLGGDLVTIWHQHSHRPGRTGLATLARAWQVSQTTGAAMEQLLHLVAVELGREHRVAGMVEAELAGTRATARLLSGLPLAGLALGFVLGGDPLAFVTGEVLGQICLVVAAILVCAGLLWVERIADSQHRSIREQKE